MISTPHASAILALALPCAAAATEPRAAWQARVAQRPRLPRPARPPGGRAAVRRLSRHRARIGHYVAPQLSSREVRAHRSTLGAEAANGPNFAANYTIAAWGCGFSCSAAAIINLGNGRVAFPRELRRISTRYVRDWVSDRPLRYRGMRFNPGQPPADRDRQRARRRDGRERGLL